MCMHCAAGDAPVKMKRQWIHHDPKTGRIAVCSDFLMPTYTIADAMKAIQVGEYTDLPLLGDNKRAS